MKYKFYVRPFKQGDKIFFEKKSKKISDIFIDKKIPHFLREKFPILFKENNDILLIPGIINKNFLDEKHNSEIIIKFSFNKGTFFEYFLKGF